MVCEWGMSEKLGPLNYGTKHEEIFLGKEIQQHRDYSEKTAIEIDEEVKYIINSCMVRAIKILEDNMEMLHKLSAELLEREILDSEEINKIMRGEELPPVPKNGGKDEMPEHVKELLKKREPVSNSSNEQ